jgi:DNA-directed RNA polymerase subunit RPC12/RpoP
VVQFVGRFIFSMTVVLKCPCARCGGNLEFPAEGVGQVIACPHCGEKTKLMEVAQKTEGSRSPQKRPFLLPLALAVAVAVAVAFGIFALKTKPPANPATQETKASSAPKATLTDWNGLKSGAVTLEKSGGRLIYAVGTILNGSSRQRFGVTVELDLFDSENKKVGTASDYVAVIEPGQEWKFQALVTDRGTDRAEVVGLKEN